MSTQQKYDDAWIILLILLMIRHDQILPIPTITIDKFHLRVLHTICLMLQLGAYWLIEMIYRAGGTGWAGWAIALPDLAVDAIYNY